MRPSNYTLHTRYSYHAGACRLCAMPWRLVERRTPFRTAFFTDLQERVITRCTGCGGALDFHGQRALEQESRPLA